MNKIMYQAMMAVMVCALTCSAALAEKKSKQVTFQDDVTVGGSVVKKGTYKVTFDDETNELTVSKDKKTIAKSQARLEKREGKAMSSIYATRTEGAKILTSVTMDGGDRAILLHEARSGATSQQQ